MKDVEVPKDYHHEKEIKWQENWQSTRLYQFNPMKTVHVILLTPHHPIPLVPSTLDTF